MDTGGAVCGHVPPSETHTAVIMKAPRVHADASVEVPKLHNIKLLIAFIHTLYHYYHEY